MPQRFLCVFLKLLNLYLHLLQLDTPSTKGALNYRRWHELTSKLPTDIWPVGDEGERRIECLAKEVALTDSVGADDADGSQ